MCTKLKEGYLSGHAQVECLENYVFRKSLVILQIKTNHEAWLSGGILFEDSLKGNPIFAEPTEIRAGIREGLAAVVCTIYQTKVIQ